MKLASTVILTSRIERLARFYTTLLEREPTWYRDDYVAFDTPGSTLALFTVTGHDEHIRRGVAEGGENRSVKIEFEVDDIGAVYKRLQSRDETFDWVRRPPVEMPWGTKIVVLRDPDGHLLEIFARTGTEGN